MTKEFVVIGDTHANHSYITYQMKMLNLQDMILLHVGDFGVGFNNIHTDKLNLRRLNDSLAERNCHLYTIRGNHDDPAFFTGDYEYSHLHLVPDYTVVNVNGDNVLMVGGAVSIDRVLRKEDMLKNTDRPSYWYDETFVLNEEKIKDLTNITYVITHSSPKFVFPINNFNNELGSHGHLVEHFATNDSLLKDDLNKEREDITQLYEILNKNNTIKKWIYGHFHSHNAEYYGDTDFICLGVNEFYNIIQE